MTIYQVILKKSCFRIFLFWNDYSWNTVHIQCIKLITIFDQTSKKKYVHWFDRKLIDKTLWLLKVLFKKFGSYSLKLFFFSLKVSICSKLQSTKYTDVLCRYMNYKMKVKTCQQIILNNKTMKKLQYQLFFFLFQIRMSIILKLMYLWVLYKMLNLTGKCYT